MAIYFTAPSQSDLSWDFFECSPRFNPPGLYCPIDERPTPDDVDALMRLVSAGGTVVVIGPRLMPVV
jgi:hypothetical protein